MAVHFDVMASVGEYMGAPQRALGHKATPLSNPTRRVVARQSDENATG